jgi:hypothetical protein
MVSVDRRDLPVYTLADLPSGTKYAALTVARRWRVVIEQIDAIHHDVVLETVLHLRAAGQTSPARIADLLQLPEGLIRHLLAQAVTEQWQVDVDGQLRARRSKVAWIYRDMATGELWPDPAPEVPPLPVRFSGRYRGRYKRGTAGRPEFIDFLVLDADEHGASEPTTIELARFGQSSAGNGRRTAVVGSAELCLVASPVVGLVNGCAIEISRGIPHLSLTRYLTRVGRERPAVARWLAEVPKAVAAPTTRLPLRQAISELRYIAGQLTSPPFRPDEFDNVLSRIELCASRFVDQYRYLHRLDAEPAHRSDDTADLEARYGLDSDTATRLVRAKRATLGHKIARLLLAARRRDPDDEQMLRSLAAVAAATVTIGLVENPHTALTELVEATIALCDRLMTASEQADVQQAG